MANKIATCCYCGTRTSLAYKSREQQELACSNCGAPLEKVEAVSGGPKKRSEEKKRSRDWDGGKRDWDGRRRDDDDDDDDRRRKKKKKPLWKRALGEAIDIVDDIFD